MSKEIAIGMLRAGKNGGDILAILETLIQDSSTFDYIESPMIEQILGIPTSEEIAF
jgi:hypothetical protein